MGKGPPRGGVGGEMRRVKEESNTAGFDTLFPASNWVGRVYALSRIILKTILLPSIHAPTFSFFKAELQRV